MLETDKSTLISLLRQEGRVGRVGLSHLTLLFSKKNFLTLLRIGLLFNV